jgi:hypothetical protein
MRATDVAGIDLIQELRLRKWARQNYVSPERRGKNWHPIVLEEMQFRDEELRDVHGDLPASNSAFVPLAPTEVFFIDARHESVPAPKSLNIPHAVETFVG